jgi:GT2 family glycosyltransferase
MDDENYQQWIAQFDQATPEETENLRGAIDSAFFLPAIGIVPVAAGPIALEELRPFVEMLDKQLYRNWKLFSAPKSAQALMDAAASADFVLPLPLDAVLHQDALARFVLALGETADADILYADEDVMQEGKRTRPQFKTDWDPYFILGRNCVGVPALYRSQILLRTQVSKIASTTIDNFLYALTLQASEATSGDRIQHIPSVLCHRSAPPDWDRADGAAIVSAHLAAKGERPAEICPAPLASEFNRVRFNLPMPAPMVSIIVPTKDRAELIGACVDGVLQGTDYPSLELIIVDNGTTAPDALAILEAAQKNSRVRILRDDSPFNFSRLNNQAAKVAQGELLLLLNNDTKVIHPGWLAEMASLASRPDVGIVGAKLLYPNLRVQHAGLCFGNGPELYHQMRLAARDEAGPGGELALLRCAWAVTGACLAVRKGVYFEAGGLDEQNFPVAYNDIDLCLKVARKGLAILYTPYAELLHFESVSRGTASTPREAEHDEIELMAFWSKHRDLYRLPDPFYNPQLEHREGYVDFARPPRLNRFRPEFKVPAPTLSFY